MVTQGEGRVGGCLLGTHSIMFIHFNRRWSDAPWQLIMLPVCLIGLWPLVMWSICKYFLKPLINCVFTHQVLLYMLVDMLCPSSLFVYYVCLCFIKTCK